MKHLGTLNYSTLYFGTGFSLYIMKIYNLPPTMYKCKYEAYIYILVYILYIYQPQSILSNIFTFNVCVGYTEKQSEKDR